MRFLRLVNVQEESSFNQPTNCALIVTNGILRVMSVGYP